MRTSTFIFLFALLVFSMNIYAQKTANDGDWANRYVALTKTPEAEFMIRIGDIDNLGFNFPEGFDPFCGNNTPTHGYPWEPDANELAGMDRVLLPSSYAQGGNTPCGNDGYSNTENQDTKPKNMAMKLDILKGAEIKSAHLIMFVDDFQATNLCSQFKVYLNGTRFIAMENVLNHLDQTGPIGKIINVKMPDYLLSLLKEPKLNIMIDDSVTHAGDGFAIDFVKLIVNPNMSVMCKGNANGLVLDKETGEPIANAIITLPTGENATSRNDGTFSFRNLLVGLNVVEAMAKGYVPTSAQLDVMKDEDVFTTIYLGKAQTLNYQGQTISVGSSLILNNIQFELAKYDLSSSAKQELDKLAKFMNDNPSIFIELSGHTSSDGNLQGNQLLSEQRVRACRNYLINSDIDERRIVAVGFGQEKPIAPNDTPANRAKNRRVEMKIVKME